MRKKNIFEHTDYLQNDEEECMAKKGEETKPCVFPFKWKGRQYHQCTDKNAKNGKPWCAVKVNNNNMKVKKKDQWICETGCPGRGIGKRFLRKFMIQETNPTYYSSHKR